MTAGQLLALKQLRSIAAYDDHCLEIINVRDPSAEGADLWVVIGMSCDGLPSVPAGIPFRSREQFEIRIRAEFPFVPPSAYTPHSRFAGRPHVYWGTHVCVYQAPTSEWNVDDGMFGFIQRLRDWIEKAALDELDAENAAIHPPYTHLGNQPVRMVIPRVDAPVSGEDGWWGLALLKSVGPAVVEITGWSKDFTTKHQPCAVALLFSKPLPWHMPAKVSDLLAQLESFGLGRELLFEVLKVAIERTAKGEPLYVVIGTPMRGAVGGKRRQHLMAWYVEPVIADALRLATPQPGDTEEILAIRKGGDEIAAGWAKTADMHWCAVLEDRPEIVVRRDFGSPMAFFQGKTVAVWGCGALGNPVATFLARAGVRKLILRDNGIVKPGILIRQDFDEADLGRYKAKALADRLRRSRPSLEIDVDFSDLITTLRPGTDWTSGADVVIDCTASAHVQAKFELIRGSGGSCVPVISMIVDGTAAHGLMVVALADHSGGPADVFRKAKIEACKKPWLRTFADSFHPNSPNVNLFQPEPGCSDATFVGSAADSAVVAGMMLNLAIKHLNKPGEHTAFADYVTQPQEITGKTAGSPFARLSWFKDMSWPGSIEHYQIRITQAAWREIQAWISRSKRLRGPDVETGGVLFGKRDDAANIIWIDEVSGPPPDSTAEIDSFVCGTKGTREMNERIKKQSRHAVQYLGMWHTHPFSLPSPSPVDLRGLSGVFAAGELAPSKHLMLIVGTADDVRIVAGYLFSRSDFTRPLTT